MSVAKEADEFEQEFLLDDDREAPGGDHKMLRGKQLKNLHLNWLQSLDSNLVILLEAFI